MSEASSAGNGQGLRLAGPGVSTRGVSTAAVDVREAARAADDAGFDYFTYGDTVFREIYATLGLCADSTTSIKLGPGVTNPVTRNPVVTAAGISTVDEISGGRAFLGIGMGQSANAIAGMERATADELRNGLRTINSAMRRARNHEAWPAGIEIDESVVELQFVTRRVPILVATGFRQGLQIAAEMADGVMLRAGDVDWTELPRRIAQLHEWRATGPRAGDPFEVQLLLFSYITDAVEEGRKMLGGVVSARARSSTRERQLAPEQVDAFRRYHDEYDYAHHSSTVHPVNVRLMEEVGLADYFFDRFSVIGDEQVLLDRLEDIERAGVTATVVGSPFERAVDVLRAYRAKHPLPPGDTPLRRAASAR